MAHAAVRSQAGHAVHDILPRGRSHNVVFRQSPELDQIGAFHAFYMLLSQMAKNRGYGTFFGSYS